MDTRAGTLAIDTGGASALPKSVLHLSGPIREEVIPWGSGATLVARFEVPSGLTATFVPIVGPLSINNAGVRGQDGTNTASYAYTWPVAGTEVFIALRTVTGTPDTMQVGVIDEYGVIAWGTATNFDGTFANMTGSATIGPSVFVIEGSSISTSVIAKVCNFKWAPVLTPTSIWTDILNWVDSASWSN